MQLSYAALNFIMGGVLQAIAAIGNYFNAILSACGLAFPEAARLGS
jgi:hypothetical protein